MKIQPISKETISAISLYCSFIVEQLRDELKEQGHNDTGNLSKSIRFDINQTGAEIVCEFYYLNYGDNINDGTPAHKVNYKLSDLVDWAKRRGFKGSLFNLRIEHQTHGIPLKGSYKFSKNGRRTGFKDHVLKSVKADLPSFVSDDLIEPLKTMFLDGLKGVK